MDYQICTRCIYYTRVPKIQFNADGVCNYCKMIEDLKLQYSTGIPEGLRDFMQIVEKIN